MASTGDAAAGPVRSGHSPTAGSPRRQLPQQPQQQPPQRLPQQPQPQQQQQQQQQQPSEAPQKRPPKPLFACAVRIAADVAAVRESFAAHADLQWDDGRASRCGLSGMADEICVDSGLVKVRFSDGDTGWWPKKAVKRIRPAGSGTSPSTPTVRSSPAPSPNVIQLRSSAPAATPFAETDCTPIVGRCTALEMPYSRPAADREWDPAKVRPAAVLQKALEHVKGRAGKFDNAEDELAYMNEQLKSIRQDLTVQHIMTPLTTEAYECHARVCLRRGDLAEFTACQAKIRDFHEIKGMAPNKAHVREFAAYRLLFCALTGQHAELEAEIARHTRAALRRNPLRFALNVVRAATPPNAARLRQLAAAAPADGLYRELMELFLGDSPARGLRASLYLEMLQAYKPSVPREHVTATLLFAGEADTEAWLRGTRAVAKSPGHIDCSKSLASFRLVRQELGTRKDFAQCSKTPTVYGGGGGFYDPQAAIRAELEASMYQQQWEQEWEPDYSKIGWFIEGMNGEPWGEVVGDGGDVWELETGRIARKQNRGYMWRWAQW
eukprot:TRINITY_DN467_c1_g1_i2.p1 TRINITY_DN467_c1_g1~~TRINITY_DN467_c1_g1_i2.p1  ORF type:complete len:551 (+),score=218.28 TRINITY_DN467_c1_g1_i2:145-1797(+)